ncbi:MAG: hypothetical protein Q7Q71_04015 [Verrucomicrobiota bacterium JB023]|nr:hypothetical protein [Verrucomicrobiota bacterium JB023]
MKTCGLFLRLFLIHLALTPLVEATLERNLDSATISQSIIFDSDEVDGDPNTNRYGIEGTFQATISIASNPIGESHEANYRIAYQLIDADDNVVPLANGGTSHTAYTDPQYVDLSDLAIFPDTPTPTANLEFVGIADPANTLSDFKARYRLVAQLQYNNPGTLKWFDVPGETLTTTERAAIHFTNTTSGDDEYNIRALVTEPTWTKVQALDTDEDNDSFAAQVYAVAYRYDDFDEVPNEVTTTLSFDFDIIEASTNRSILLENDGIVTANWQATSHNGDLSRPLPQGFFLDAIDADLKPLEQLLSGSETYFVRCTLTHTETAEDDQYEDGSCDGIDEQLLHFDGDLFFGAQATLVNEFANEPTAGTSGPDYVNTVVQVATGAGSFPDRPDIVFGTEVNLQVRLYDNGDMILQSGSELAATGGAPLEPVNCPDIGGLTYNTVSLGTYGFRANGYRLQFPQGLVYFPNLNVNRFMGQPDYTAATQLALNSVLCPPGGLSISFGADAAITDESHPILFGTSGVDVGTDRKFEFSITSARYTHQDAYDLLETLATTGQLDSSSMAVRCSNERYFLDISNVASNALVTTAEDGTARLSTDIEVQAGKFQTHFPLKSTISYDNSPLAIREGEISASDGSVLEQVQTIDVPYKQTCPDDNCTATIPSVVVSHEPESDRLWFTNSGGLFAESDSINGGSGHQLEWGKRSLTQYAHRTGTFTKGNFYMPGYQLYAQSNTLLSDPVQKDGAADNAACALLLSGFNRDLDNPDLHLFAEKEYLNGNGDYAGLTFEVDSSNFGGASRLAGVTEDYTYDLFPDQNPDPDANEGAKYYIREAGVSGRQVATEGTYDEALKIHGFECGITQFQLSFLENNNEADGCDSWVDGSIEVQGYSNWDQEFTALRFDCLGEPGEMTPNLSEADGKSLSYWNSSFDLKTLRFITYPDPDAEPNPDPDPDVQNACPKRFLAKLAAGAKTRVAHVDQDLFGTLAFCPDGNLSTLQDALDYPVEFEGIDSQLRIPATIPLSGPNKDYNLVTSTKLRFNNPQATPSPAVGFVTFWGTIDIPYFEDLQVQAITSASDNPGALFYLTPGFELSGSTAFELADFDPTHRGFPTTGIDQEDYRDPKQAGITDSQYLIHATQRMFGFIPLEYPLYWDVNTRRFQSSAPVEQDIFVAQMEHKIDWMDAKFTNISFGATYDGLPQLKISNWLNGEIDKAADAIAQELGELPKQGIDRALEELDKMLEDSLEQMIDPVVDAAAAGPLLDLHAALIDNYHLLTPGTSYLTYRDQLEDILNTPGDALYGSEFFNPIRSHLQDISDTSGEAYSFILQIRSALSDIIKGIDYITTGVDQAQDYTSNVEAPTLPPGDLIGGLLKKTNGERTIVTDLIELLLIELVEPDVRAIIQPLLESLTSSLNEELNVLLEDIDPTLEQIQEALTLVRGFLKDAYDVVDDAAGIGGQINGIIQDLTSGAAINDLLEPIGTRAWNYFLQLEAAAGIDPATATNFDIGDAEVLQIIADLDGEEFIELVKVELKDAILESDAVKQTQNLLRQTLYDISDKVTSALQSVLAEMSNVMKEAISSNLEELEESINPLLGEISDYMGSGEISGYAEFNGDSLRKLRLDAKMQFDIPDEMSLHVYLEILCYSSEDNFVESGCVKPGEKVVEVRIGAKDVSVEWISECKINLEVKLTLKDYDGDGGVPPLPIGVGGKFELTDGGIDFEAFRIIEFGACIAVGLEDCYIAAKAKIEFSSYGAGGAFFFGRSCTLEPLLFVDPDIGDVVEAGTTFTGAYVYCELCIPVLETLLGIKSSCLLRLDACIGAGAFFFVEGPTFGGKIFLGVEGEAICLVTIGGEIKIILALQSGRLRGAGTGKFYAKIGWCPFCVKFSKSIKLIYDDGSWSMQ